MLGALIKELHVHNLYSPRPEVPFPQLSFDIICENVRALKSPVWATSHSFEHGCSLNTAVQEVIKKAKSAVIGLDMVSLKGDTL
jgi:hypothetical protein